MRVWLLIVVTLLSACASKPEPPPAKNLMTPGTRLIYHGGAFGLWSVCDRPKSNLLYLTENGGFQVVPGGCTDGQP